MLKAWSTALTVGLVFLATPVAAHPLAFTDTTLTLRPDGTFQVDMVCDLDALALGISQDADDAELVAALEALTPDEFTGLTRRLRDLFLRRVRIRFDDEPVLFEVAFPDYDTPSATEAEIPTVLGLTARLTGTIPPGSAEVEFFASRSFSDVHLTIVDEARNHQVRMVLERGARSDPFEITGPVSRPSRGQVAGQYLRLGFIHIVPDGADHILFVVGLFLLSPYIRPLLWQVTAFTVAHAVTLALGTLDIVTLSPRIVEPAIALSIGWVAVENMFTSRLSRWRPLVVFLFGLMHGLGFAGVLSELGLPSHERVLGLLAFNVGIELGQLAIIAVALGTVGWFRHRAWYRPRVVIPLSALIGLVGLVWTVERVLA